MASDALTREYQKLARKADDHLRSLEALAGQENYKSVLNWSYKRAIRDVRSWGGTNRFGKGKGAISGLTDEQVRSKMADMKTFLESSTSSKRKITGVYRQRAETLNKELGLTGKDKIRWQEWASFWNSDAYKEMKKYFDGSDTLVSVLAQFRTQKYEILQAIKDNDFRHISIEPEMVKEGAVDFLQNNGIDILSMFD